MIKTFSFIVFLSLFFASCHKADVSTPSENFATTEQTVINDFVNNTALPQYSNLVSSAVSLNNSVQMLQASATDENLAAAQSSWKNMRAIWEQCEGFLIGPVEDNDYDPNTDTWPTDYAQMDSLLSSSNPLQTSNIEALPQAMRGYHPIEYIIFGIGGTKKVSDITPRQMQYLSSLTGDMLYNNVQELYQSWAAAPGNYAQQLLTAGNGGNIYTKKQDLFLAIIGAMSDICNEVGAEKMYNPYINKDSFLTESPYSGNTLIDFKNNIIGVRNVYLGMNGNTGLKDLISSRNKNLDNQIRAQLTTAINSFDNIKGRYEEAILTQRVQIEQTMQQIEKVKALFQNDVTNFIKQNVLD